MGNHFLLFCEEKKGRKTGKRSNETNVKMKQEIQNKYQKERKEGRKPRLRKYGTEFSDKTHCGPLHPYPL
jgi:hypothetical protein